MNENNMENPHPNLLPLKGRRSKRNYPSPSKRERLGEGGLLARNLRKNQTDAERSVWFLLRDRRFKGLKFRRQYQIGFYVVDFCCVEKQLILELDGGQHALQKENDEQRTRFFQNYGYEVLRFWNHDVLRDPQAVLEVIEKFSAPPPSSPPSPFKREKE